jgi:8-oxo-dGTP pyrophosphatase MutT (NUDIX family)
MNATPPLKPRDAASLVLYRRRQGRIDVLMGQRHAGHVFMPNRFVFPGGRVDPEDRLVNAATALRTEVATKLARGCRSAARPHALAIAAVRETYEETGLMLARPSPLAEGLDTRHWAGFHEAGLAPALDRLDYIFRAITPPGMVRRFDARFFLAEADETVTGTLGGNGELENTAWLPIDEALALPLSMPTNLVLQESARLIEAGASRRSDHNVPLLVTRRGRHVLRTE